MEINSAAASDGGSLWLGISENGHGSSYFLNRSIGARGTATYEQISSEQGVLSPEEQSDLLDKLVSIRKTMGTDNPNFQTLKEFLAVLLKQAPKRP